jgi:hypothetical protein
MAEGDEDKGVKPIKIDAHECPLCHLKRFGSAKYMQRHIDNNPVVDLPVGFLYRSEDTNDDPARPAYFVIVTSRLSMSHQGIYQTMFLSDAVVDRTDIALGDIKDKEIRDSFAKGISHIVEGEELARVNEEYQDMLEVAREKYGVTELITTTPELEKMMDIPGDYPFLGRTTPDGEGPGTTEQ